MTTKCDIECGDIVQVTHGKNAGTMGMVIGSRYEKSSDAILYTLKLSDKQAIFALGATLRILRKGDEA